MLLSNLYTFFRYTWIALAYYAILKDRCVTCRRRFKMDVLLASLGFVNLGCFLVFMLNILKNYTPEWMHDFFEWGKTKRVLNCSRWTQAFHVPNRYLNLREGQMERVNGIPSLFPTRKWYSGHWGWKLANVTGKKICYWEWDLFKFFAIFFFQNSFPI